MSLGFWLRSIGAVIGGVALGLLIWLAGPLVAIGEVRPLEGFWPRLGLVVLVAIAVAAAIGFDFWRRRKATAELEQAIGESGDEAGDAAVLQETIKDALTTLRKAKGTRGRDYLYELPWYVMIGPPGSGKTTALVNSGLKFPLVPPGSSPEALRVGGTRYCDWWFTEDAVLIDTAGRYTTQDSDPKADRTSWLSFLDLLKENRPRQPINGVLVAISIEDLLTANEEELNAHAVAIRKRLIELHERLKIDFPVYAIFTKADLVAGFKEFFGLLNESERRMVWGATFQTDDKTRNMIGEAPAEFDLLIERLNQHLPDRMQEEPNPTSRVLLFGFPNQMVALKRPVMDFLNRVFEPTRYHANATLRGFYFASGTQQGTPIDQLIGSLASSFGSEEASAAAFSGIGRSYFLTDLLKQVVIGEAGWVSTNRAAVRRSRIVKGAIYGAVAAASASAVVLWLTSYAKNSALIGQTNNAVAEYRTIAAPVLTEVVVADRDFGKVLPLLHKLRSMPAGYAVREEPTPIPATFGLSQRERLQSSSETAYDMGLERLFRSRLIFRLEEVLEARLKEQQQPEANRPAPGSLYEALKAYLMIGGQAPVDRDFVRSWMRQDWAENLYPGAANARGREALDEHLMAMFDLDPGREPQISLNESLIAECQRTLARMSVAERAYELLKSQAKGASYRDWVVARVGGQDAGLVFEAKGGEDLDSVRVPFFFTYDGFNLAFIDRLGDIAEHVERERWVLGEAGKQSAFTEQYGTLFADLLRRYAGDFEATWKQTLNRLKIRSLTADKPRYVTLAAAAAPTSPIKQLLESIRDETRLTRERPAAKDGKDKDRKDPAAAAGRAALGKGIEEAQRKVSSALPSSISSIATEAARAGLQGGGGAAAQLGRDRFGSLPSQAPGANIEAQFREFYAVLDGDPGRRAIDQLLQALSEISQNLAIAATYPAQMQQANNALVTQIANLRALAPRFPQPVETMLRAAASEFARDATGGLVAQLRQTLAAEVIAACRPVIEGRYPFFRASDREVPIGDFGALFSPNGVFDKYFTQNLAHLVDRSKPIWTWRADNRIARGLAPATLLEFQRAAQIRDAFFPTGGVIPSFGLTVQPLTLSADAATAKFEINGQVVNSQQGVNTPTSVQWPGSGAGLTSITLMTAGSSFLGFTNPPQQIAKIQKEGVWSLYRMLDATAVVKQGDAIVATFAITPGREVSYKFTVNSVVNPLTLPALREFRCPTGI